MTTKAPDLLPCDTCGLPVTVDAVVANDVWARISPTHDEGGYLCPTCVARRLADIEGWPAVRMTDSRADLYDAVVAERDRLAAALDAEPPGQALEIERLHEAVLLDRAETAAVIEAAAKLLEDGCYATWTVASIRALTPAHAAAALGEIKRQAREDALREAADVVDLAPYKREAMVCGCSEGLSAYIRNSVLALIDKAPEDR